jgi:hypothetical protein
MKTIDLIQQQHNVQIGDICGHIEPNITEDTIFMHEGEPVGFYIKQIQGKLRQYIEIANAELLSDRVPKSVMDRKRPLGEDDNGKRQYLVVSQYSTIIGSCPPKPHMRRPYPSMSSVHQVKSAQTFIKAMLLACKEAEDVVREITPNIFERQKNIIETNIPAKWRFGRLFTSSISNFNIPAPFHRDAGNLEGCVNVIIAKKENATGGNTTVPDYAATMDSSDNSMLVYPAWRNVHGVTPIVPTKEGGYRNSLVFYPLKAFKGLE